MSANTFVRLGPSSALSQQLGKGGREEGEEGEEGEEERGGEKREEINTLRCLHIYKSE